MNGATRERGAAELQTKAQAETLKTQEAVTGAEAVTALIAVHSVQCGWQGRDRWSSQSVNGKLTAPLFARDATRSDDNDGTRYRYLRDRCGGRHEAMAVSNRTAMPTTKSRHPRGQDR